MKVGAIVFDVDNTLTPPRAPIREEMAEVLCRLDPVFHLAAGSDLKLVMEQLVEPLAEYGFEGRFDAFVCNGADRYRCLVRGGEVEVQPVSRFALRDHLGETAFDALLRSVSILLNEREFCLEASGVPVRGEQIINRGSMINVVPMGRPAQMDAEAYAQRAAFVEFDRRTGYRLRLLERLRTLIAPWQASHGLRVTLGGQTSFDIVVEGHDKRFPLRALLSEGVQRILYFGDALHPEGNDRAVLEFIDEWAGVGNCPVEAVAVENWEDTRCKLLNRRLVREEPLVAKGRVARSFDGSAHRR
ncbi:MAG: hypothetical protein N3C12_15635 [Candidatus Binatia bacterium]|nr:hypothetical protein [Candidatus Binatia bacterium]